MTKVAQKNTKVATQTFEEVLQAVYAKQKEAEEKQRKLEEAARKAKKEREELGGEVARLNRIAYLSSHCNMEWTERDGKVPAIAMAWELKTSTLEFTIYLKETDLKRDKYRVVIRGTKRDMGKVGHEIHGGYTDHDYIKKTYMKQLEYNNYEEIKGQELDKKFKTEEEARAYAEQWKKRITEDHMTELVNDRRLLDLCRKSGFKYDDRRKFW